MQTISWQQFEMIELIVGTLVRVEPFPEARRPAYKVWADFGPEIGVRKSSAQITDLYRPEELVGRQIVAVVNFPPKQIGPIQSEFLLTGFYRADGAVIWPSRSGRWRTAPSHFCTAPPIYDWHASPPEQASRSIKQHGNRQSLHLQIGRQLVIQ